MDLNKLSIQHLSILTFKLQTLIELFEKCDVNHDNDIDQNEASELNAQLFYMVPRIGFDYEGTVYLWCSINGRS